MYPVIVSSGGDDETILQTDNKSRRLLDFDYAVPKDTKPRRHQQIINEGSRGVARDFNYRLGRVCRLGTDKEIVKVSVLLDCN